MSTRNKVQWKELWIKQLLPLHANHTNKIYNRIKNKPSALKSSLKRRSKEAGVKCTITLNWLKKNLLKAYGTSCKYCDTQLTYKNITLDHIIPLCENGNSTSKNLQFICSRCNRIKGPLLESEFKVLLKTCNSLPDRVYIYVMRKLSKGGKY